MKAILKFNLPEDKSDFEFCINGFKYWSVLWDFDNNVLRPWDLGKADHNFKDADEAIEEIRKRLYEILGDYELSIDGPE